MKEFNANQYREMYMKNKTSNSFLVRITAEGSQNALPAIWYGGMENEVFSVIKSMQYPSMYEVTEGKHRRRLIDPVDCTKTLNH